MKIFINDIPVYLIKASKSRPEADYDLVIDGSKKKISPKKLIDDVLILNASPQSVEELLFLMTEKKLKQVDSITFASGEKEKLIKFIKSTFKVVEAAGGVVEKEGKNLLIFRQGKWDLPKGKLDKGESPDDCAVREVEEETGVKVALDTKIGHTWHTYIHNKKYVLKKTHWYIMKTVDDRNMAPQKEEGIDEVKWMTLNQMRAALYDSYRSIRAVIQDYHRLLKEKTNY
ncbi:MAG: NUDIX hydrolase [Cyclobacteriaceae bacterium]|nr:NUDIX hydrolase [Cyclobacteriaceae bacterium]